MKLNYKLNFTLNLNKAVRIFEVYILWINSWTEELAKELQT